MKNGKHGLMSISEFAAYCGSTRQTMQYYDRIGLLHPMRVGDQGYRYYHPLQAHEFQLIHSLRSSGCSLEEIDGILASPSIEELELKLQEKQKALEQELENIRLQKHYLKRTGFFLSWIEHCRDSVPRVRRLEKPLCFQGVSFAAPTELYSERYYQVLRRFSEYGKNNHDARQYPHLFYVGPEEIQAQRRFTKLLHIWEPGPGFSEEPDYILEPGPYIRMLYFPQRTGHTRAAAYEEMFSCLEQNGLEARDGCLELPFCIPRGLRQNSVYPFAVLYILPLTERSGSEEAKHE